MLDSEQMWLDFSNKIFLFPMATFLFFYCSFLWNTTITDASWGEKVQLIYGSRNKKHFIFTMKLWKCPFSLGHVTLPCLKMSFSLSFLFFFDDVGPQLEPQRWAPCSTLEPWACEPARPRRGSPRTPRSGGPQEKCVSIRHGDIPDMKSL